MNARNVVKNLLSAFATACALGASVCHAHDPHPFTGLVYGCPGCTPTVGFVKHIYTGGSVVPLGELVNPAPGCAGLTLLGVRVEARASSDGGPQISVLVGGQTTSVPETVALGGTGPYYFPTTIPTPNGLIAPTGSTINLAALRIVGDVWVDRVILIWGPGSMLVQQPLADNVQQQEAAPAPIQQHPIK